jgi:hypothetical protein
MWLVQLVWLFTTGFIAPDGVPVYDIPSADGVMVVELPAGTLFEVIGRTDTALWLEIHTEQAQGWVYANTLYLALEDLSLFDVPVTAIEQTPLDMSRYPSESMEYESELIRLMQTPILYQFDSPYLTDIYTTGQTFGNREAIFIKVGDSNSTSGDYLRPFGMRFGGCAYGLYDDLLETVEFFSAESPYPTFPNSFDVSNVTAQNGLNTFGVFDPFWASTADYCQAGESPLTCEYRVLQPSIALTMIGLMDLEQIPVEVYQRNLHQLVGWLVDHGVIPVLSTFPVLNDYPEAGERSLWGKSVELNIAILNVAEEYGIPLVNLWAAFQRLPDYGIGPDRTHIRHELGAFCDFTGAEFEVSGTLRNYYMVLALDILRREVFEAE